MANFSVTELSRFIESSSQKPFWMGLDVHKRNYYIALLRFDGSIFTWSAPADPIKIVELIDRYKICLSGACYEAGPTGFSLARTLISAGIPVTVAAPNKIPRSVSPGSKTDRLDCTKLALFVSKGFIRPINIPSAIAESERALMRRRHQVTNSIRRCKQRIKALFLYNGLKEPESLKRWSQKSVEELHSTVIPESAKLVLESHIRNLEFHLNERKIIDRQLEVMSHKSEHEAVIDALMTVPGIGLLTAMAFHLEIYEPERFQRKEEIASYLGLAPTVKHSGEKHPRGHLVPVGQKRLRSLLIEVSWIWVAHDKYASNLYHKFLGKTGIPQKAIAAVARKLTIILWRLSIEKRAYKSVA